MQSSNRTKASSQRQADRRKASIAATKPKKSARTLPVYEAPVAMTRVARNRGQKIQNLPNGDCVITHREYLGEVTAGSGAPSAFTVGNNIRVNAGVTSCFPWLSTIARAFESYVFEELRFCYDTEAPSSLGGSLVMTVDYDALDTVPVNKQAMMAYRGSVRSAPWKACEHVSQREDLHKMKSYYVSSGAVPAGSDLKTYDVGRLYVATQNVTTASAVCGELYVEYRVRLMTPLYGSSIPLSSTVAGNGALTPAAIFGPPGVGGIAGTVIGGLNVTGPSGNVVGLLGLTIGQEYSASLYVTGTGISAGPTCALSGANATTNVSGFPAAATSGFCFTTFVATQAAVTLTYSLTATTVTASDLVLAQIPNSSF